MKTFTPDQLKTARAAVADQWRDIARRRDQENAYAAHVTAERKAERLEADLAYADEIAAGQHDNCVTVWQRMVHHLTGESVPLLP